MTRINVFNFFSALEIICRQNGQERECTKVDFQLHEKYKDYLCSSAAGNNPHVCDFFIYMY